MIGRFCTHASCLEQNRGLGMSLVQQMQGAIFKAVPVTNHGHVGEAILTSNMSVSATTKTPKPAAQSPLPCTFAWRTAVRGCGVGISLASARLWVFLAIHVKTVQRNYLESIPTLTDHGDRGLYVTN